MSGRSGCGFAEASEEGHLGGGAGTEGSKVGTSSHSGKEVSDGGWHGARRPRAMSGCRGVELAAVSGLSSPFFLEAIRRAAAIRQLC